MLETQFNNAINAYLGYDITMQEMETILTELRAIDSQEVDYLIAEHRSDY